MGYVSRTTTTLPDFIGSDFAGFVELSRVHKDSWGLALTAGDRVALEKKAITAAEDSSFASTVGSRQSDAGLLHFRWASPGLGVTDTNAHPFAYKDISLIHNGAIMPYDALEPLVAPEFLALRQGTTDSELYFLFLLTRISQLGFIDGVKSAIETLRKDFSYSSINSMIMNRDYLVVISEHDSNNKPDWADEIYYELRYRADERGLAVASSGWNQEGWELMPNHSILIYNRADFSHSLSSL